MKDETYVFIQDNKEKKAIARSSHARRSHAGKGGRVRFPSDKLTKKELEAMNGEIKSYKMNEPMAWKEFKRMPDDLKIMYVKSLREKYSVSDKRIAEECLGINRVTFVQEVKRLGIGLGKKAGGANKNCDVDGWNAWLGKTDRADETAETVNETTETNEPVPAPVVEIETEPVNEKEPVPARAIPYSGTMQFNGKVDEILTSIYNLLGDSKVHVGITWSIREEEA